MTHDPHAPDFELPATAAEWDAQERARLEQRLGRDPQATDPAARRYRPLARLLAQPLEAQLPPDFARQVARQVERAPGARTVDLRVEQALLGVLAVAMLVAVLLYAGAWLPSLEQGPAGVLLGTPWLWALALCLGLSRLCDRWLLRTPQA